MVVGSAHSPSDLTCTSSWLVNLDFFNKVLSVDEKTHTVVTQAGIRLRDLGRILRDHGLSLANIGSIDEQSIAGAIGTATHGSSTRHGLLSQSVLGLKIMLANGCIFSCSAERNPELFRAALVSLGALGIITEVTFQAVPNFKIEWSQSLHSLQDVIADWERDLWTQEEFVRIWWMPYMKRCIQWRASKTKKPLRPPKSSWWRDFLGFHAYHASLYVAQWFPTLLPIMEKFVISVQYGLTGRADHSAVEEGHPGLLMNCLFSQFVNEWAIPLHRGPEALSRLSAWLNGDADASRIPFSAKGLYVHAPIEVRVCDTSTTKPRPFLDNTQPDGPTLYLNATLYRPFHRDPPCRERYYQAFEWLMKEMGGRPHWAKNFTSVTSAELRAMYPEIDDWLRVRNEVDPEGMFIGDWHRRLLLGGEEKHPTFPLEEQKVSIERARGGGLAWKGHLPLAASSPQLSEESFEIMHGVEAEESWMDHSPGQKDEEEEEL